MKNKGENSNRKNQTKKYCLFVIRFSYWTPLNYFQPLQLLFQIHFLTNLNKLSSDNVNLSKINFTDFSVKYDMIDIVLQILLFQYRTILQILLFMCLQTLLFIETVFIIISLNIRILICLFISLEHDVCFYVRLLLSVTDSSNMFSEHNIRHSGLNIFHLYNLKVIILPIWRYQGFKRESF